MQRAGGRILPSSAYLLPQSQITHWWWLSPREKRLHGEAARSVQALHRAERTHTAHSTSKLRPSPAQTQSSLPGALSQHPAASCIPSPPRPQPRASPLEEKGGFRGIPRPWIRALGDSALGYGFTPMQFGTKTPTRAPPLLTFLSGLCQPSPPGSHRMEMYKLSPARHGPETGARGHGTLINPRLRLALASL